MENVFAIRQSRVFFLDFVLTHATIMLRNIGVRRGFDFGRVGSVFFHVCTLRVNHQVRMIARLSQSCEKLEDVRVVVQNAPFLHERVELRARQHVQRLVKVLFNLIECVLLNDYLQVRQSHVLGAFRLGPAKLHRQQNVVSKSQHRFLAITDVAITVDWVQHGAIEMRIMPGRAASAVGAKSRLRTEVPGERFALATLRRTKVKRVRIHAQKSHQAVQIADSILQRCTCQTPLIRGFQSVDTLGGVARARLDLVRFVENDSVPLRAMKKRIRQIYVVFVFKLALALRTTLRGLRHVVHVGRLHVIRFLGFRRRLLFPLFLLWLSIFALAVVD